MGNCLATSASKQATAQDPPQPAAAAASSNKQADIVILGAGNSAGYAVRQFVLSGVAKDRILLLGREPDAPYERPALSKGYLKPESPARLPGFHTSVGGGGDRQDPEWYKSHGIEFMGGQTVTSVDPATKQLRLESGQTVEYQKLIVATGIQANRLDKLDPKSKLFYLRDVADADAITAAIGKHGKGAPAVVIGGGYIGTEVAAALSSFGLEVTLVNNTAHILGRLFTSQLAAVYERAFAEKGVTIVPDARVAECLYDTEGEVSGVKLADGKELAAKIVVAGVGGRADLSLFEGKLDTTAGGVKVNEFLQTSNPDIFAIGDVAAFPLTMAGGEVQCQGHVVNARLTAALAAKNILADESGEALAPYEYVPKFYSRIFGFAWQFYGLAKGSIHHFGDLSEGKKFGAVWIGDGTLHGLLLEGGSSEEYAAVAAVAKEQPSCSGVEEVNAILLKLLGEGFSVHTE